MTSNKRIYTGHHHQESSSGEKSAFEHHPGPSSSSAASEWSSTGTPSSATTTNDGLEERFQKALTLEAATQHRLLEEEEVIGLTQEELDGLYAKDMHELTGKERDEVLQDIHGVSDAIEETPNFVHEHRQWLDTELEELVRNSWEDTAAYETAMEQNASFVQSESFQLLFLRAERFVIHAAATSLVGFLGMKQTLFGTDRLTRSITISDLSKDDRKSLGSGFVQLLPVRDVAGRVIVSAWPMLAQYKEPANLKRTFYYMVMTALEDVETQKSGMVLIGYNIGPNRTVNRTVAMSLHRVRRYLPLHCGGIHYCYDDFLFRPMMTVAMLVMGASSRVRFRAHYGTHAEVMYELLTFGIPNNILAVSSEGEPRLKNHKGWLKLRERQEETLAKKPVVDPISIIIVLPIRHDVLSGRGKPIQEHFGNLRYHAFLDYYQDAYERTKKFDKMKITQRVIDTVHGYGGRFLKEQEAGWARMDEPASRDKVAHAFRTRRTTSAKDSNNNSNNNSDGGDSSINNITSSRVRVTKRDNLEITTESIPENDPSSRSTPGVVEGSQTRVTIVTDTERDRSSSEEEIVLDPTTVDRVKLWASSFYEVSS